MQDKHAAVRTANTRCHGASKLQQAMAELQAQHAQRVQGLEALLRECEAQVAALDADRRALQSATDQHVRDNENKIIGSYTACGT